MTRAERTAARLGLTEPVVRRLQARGHLDGLDLSEREARERLWRGHAGSVAPKPRRRPWLAPFVRDPDEPPLGGPEPRDDR